LRFGLPARFRAVVMEPSSKAEKKLIKSLCDMYKGLLTHDVEITNDVYTKNAMGIVGNEEFFPFVFMDLFIEKGDVYGGKTTHSNNNQTQNFE